MEKFESTEARFQKILDGDPEHPVQLAIAKLEDPADIRAFADFIVGKMGITQEDIKQSINTMSRVAGMEARAARWRETLEME